jgi:hypothetical protein
MGGASRPLVNPFFAQLEPVPLSLFLDVKGRPFEAFDLYD